MPVLDRKMCKNIGSVADVLIEKNSLFISGFLIEKLDKKSCCFLPYSCIESVLDAIVLNADCTTCFDCPTDTKNCFSNLLGKPIYTKSGKLLGALHNAYFSSNGKFLSFSFGDNSLSSKKIVDADDFVLVKQHPKRQRSDKTASFGSGTIDIGSDSTLISLDSMTDSEISNNTTLDSQNTMLGDIDNAQENIDIDSALNLAQSHTPYIEYLDNDVLDNDVVNADFVSDKKTSIDDIALSDLAKFGTIKGLRPAVDYQVSLIEPILATAFLAGDFESLSNKSHLAQTDYQTDEFSPEDANNDCANKTKPILPERAILNEYDFLLGRKLKQDVYSKNGKVVVAKNTILTSALLCHLQKSGLLIKASQLW